MPARPRREMLPQPHDALFKWTFGQRQHAAGLLRAALPPEVVAAIDFRSLRIEKDSFVDPALRSRHSDLVLSARLRGRPIYFHVLFEHQRKVEPLMILRMSIYMHRLWEKLVRDRPELTEIPPILPVLLHHSKGGWTAARAFQDIVAIDPEVAGALRPHTPCFEMRVLDLSEGEATHLVEQALTALGRVVLWCMSVAGDDARLLHEIDRFLALLEEVIQAPDGLAALNALMRYIAATHEQASAMKVARILEKAGGPRTKEGIVTWIDELEQRCERRGELRGERRGERRGELRGEQKGRAMLLLRQMEERFGRVPAEIAARIEAADVEALDRWAIRVLTARTAQDVIDGGEEGSGARRRSAPKAVGASARAGRTQSTAKRRA